MENILQVLLNGLQMGLLYALMALGFTIIFGMMHVVNFAHGQLLMIGAVVAFTLTISSGLNYFLALPLTILIMAIIGFLLDMTMFRRIRTNIMAQIVLSIGLGLVLVNLALIFYGLKNQSIGNVFPGTADFLGAHLSFDRIMAMGFAVIFILALYWLIKKTRLGRAMRAVQQNPEAAALQGVSVGWTYGLSWALAAALAGAAGALMAPIFPVGAAMGYRPMAFAFVTVILGGLGSVPGAVVGALVIGFAESLISTFAGSQLAWGAIFLLAVIILIVRPQGLFKGYI